MSEVVDLKSFVEKKPAKVLSCGACECQLFYIRYDEIDTRIVLECRGCGSFVNNMEVEQK
jgi:hypothetical protein